MRSYVICCVQRTGSWLLAHTLAVAAVVAGMRGYTAIAGWVKDVPPPVLADLYLRAGAGPARPPSKATIWRVITDAGADMLDAAVGSWLMSSLLSEPAGQGEVAAQARTRMI
jgi:LPS sulfotransferase NodH